MEQFIIDYLESANFKYVKINDESDLLIIYDLFKNNIVGDKYNSTICMYYGFYYKNVKKDYNMMKKYYLIAIDHNNKCSMNNLAYYYQNIEINYDLMKKYYLMAINCKNISSMYNLGYHYQYTEINYDLMKKYYLMAINNGDNSGDSMHNLAFYYQNIETTYDLMKKYYFMAVKNNNPFSINECLQIYKTVTQENINDAIYFYNIANKPKNKYNAITKAFNNGYMINNNNMTDYIQSMNISTLLSKYNNICVKITQIFLNYKQIMQLLWVIKITTNIVQKHIKLNMISLLCV